MECERIAEWFIDKYGDRVERNKLLPWSARLGIDLNKKGILDEDQLFHLFVLAVLWNNGNTRFAEIGEEVFRNIKGTYTLENFVKAITVKPLTAKLMTIDDRLMNPQVFNVLPYVANGQFQSLRVWERIKHVLDFPHIGVREDDEIRLRHLFEIFNPKGCGNAYLTVKTFLIFREIRIQFGKSNRYQFDPAICCIPDSRVREALMNLHLLENTGNKIDNLIIASRIVAEKFCSGKYELYDLPLFFWDREGRPHLTH